MLKIEDLESAIASAHEQLDYMLEDVRGGEAEAFLDSAEEAQRYIMQAVVIAMKAALKPR